MSMPKAPYLFTVLYLVMILTPQTVWTQGGDAVSAGKQLAAGYCGACHLVPEPSALDKRSWSDVILPRMGYFLGIYDKDHPRDSLMEGGETRRIILERNVFPEDPIIDEESWALIKKYYIQSAPDTLVVPQQPTLPNTTRFKAVRPAFQLSPPSTTFIDMTDDAVLVGDAFSGQLHVLDNTLQVKGAAKTTEAAVWVTESDDEMLVTVMGSFSPTDAASGMLLSLPKSSGGAVKKLIEGLQRPVHHAVADLDDDGLDDIVICEFAKWTGSLSWWKNTGSGYEQQILRYEPGAIRTIIRDWDNNGTPDIIALFGQGNESITLYRNDGKGKFTEEALLRFPPSYGSAFFDLRDLDGDGDEDIVYCAGDNADFGPILKPYHGVRIFLNEGSNEFTERVFLPLNGAYSAMVRDFDLDGDLDIAAISFFPDWKGRPSEGFVYIENQGNWAYTQSTFAESGFGRWIVMDAGDIDKDGDEDLVLGSLTFEVPGRDDLVQQWISNGIPFVLLENLTR